MIHLPAQNIYRAGDPRLQQNLAIFWTALAAQEKKVLELKEELNKVESDLEQLKKQWAIHEASKKKEEMRHVEKLRPIGSPTRAFTPEHERHSRRSLDQTRFKSGYIKNKQPQGEVFSPFSINIGLRFEATPRTTPAPRL